MRTVRYLKRPIKVVSRRRKDEKRLRWIFIMHLPVFCFILIYFFPLSSPTKSSIYNEGTYRLQNIFRERLTKAGMSCLSADDQYSNLIFSLPDEAEDKDYIDMASSHLHKSGLKLRKIGNFTGNRGFKLFVDFYQEPVGTATFIRGDIESLLTLEEQQRPKIAIIIDDFGYSNNDVIKGFLDIDEKITISVIPGHQFSRWTAHNAKERGKEVIIHMPMEPEKTVGGAEKYMLSRNLGVGEIEEKIRSAFAEIPEATGMNNHMGSYFTSERQLMRIVINSLKKKGVYFIDSLTSPKSVAYEVAKELGIPTAVRTVFLDNKREKAEIHAQFKRAIDVAKRSGSAIVIGHKYPETLEVLKEMIKDDQMSEVLITYASDLVS